VKQSRALSDTTFQKVSERTGLPIDYLKMEALLTKHVHDLLAPIVDRLDKIEARSAQNTATLSVVERSLEKFSSLVTLSIAAPPRALSGSAPAIPTPRPSAPPGATSTSATPMARRPSGAKPDGPRGKRAGQPKPAKGKRKGGDKLYATVIAFLREVA
jgi:hypothetical protein